MSHWVYLLVAITGLGVVTLLARGSFFLLPASVDLPPGIERALRYAPACALVAIIAPALLTRDGHLYASASNEQVWGVVAAALVFVKTRNMLAMMAVGMVVFTLLRLYA